MLFGTILDILLVVMRKLNKNQYVLASVFDKTGIATFCNNLNKLGYRTIATKGTRKELIKHGMSCLTAERVSRNPNKLKNCIKTISFYIEAGILFNRSSRIQTKEVQFLKIKQIDIVVCNFVPLGAVRRNPEKKFNIENIDVGGPLMVRSAATNYKDVLVVTDPNDYKKVIKMLKSNQNTIKFRKEMAQKAFKYIKSYDQKIINILKQPTS